MITEPIEQMESRIDDLAFDQCAGVPDGSIRCYFCHAVVSIGDAYPASVPQIQAQVKQSAREIEAPIKSRSNLKREAVMRGEPMPQFDS